MFKFLQFSMIFACVLLHTFAFTLNYPHLLLPLNGYSAVKFPLEVLDADDDACFEWHSSSHAIKMHPDFNEKLCSRKAFISVVSSSTELEEAIISVYEKGSNRSAICEVIVDVIEKIRLLYTVSEMSLGSPPIRLDVMAENNKGHTFSTLNNVKMKWKIQTPPNDVNKKTVPNVLKFIGCLTALDEFTCVAASTDFGMTSSISVKGETLGSASVLVELETSINQEFVSESVVLDVLFNAELKPSTNVYILPKASVAFHFETKYGQILDLGYCDIKSENTSVIDDLGNFTFLGHYYGKTKVVFSCAEHSFTSHINVVKPSHITLTANGEKNWKLHEATSYEMSVHLFDNDGNEISPLDNVEARVNFPSKLFYINSSSSNGIHHSVRALIPGAGTIKIQVSNIKTKKKMRNNFELHASQKFIIYQVVQVQPPILLLPFHNNTLLLYSVPLKASGGTGSYTWITNNKGIKIRYDKEDSSHAIADIYEEGHFTIHVIDETHSKFRSFTQIYVHPVSGIEVYATVVEAEVGNEIIVPVALYGQENLSEGKKIIRSFDDCSKINVSIEIIEKYVIAHKPDADVPPFGRGCLSLQFLCKAPGFSRINIAHESKDRELRTTVVVACHKPLKALHPIRVGVLPLGSSKDIVFEGGPRSWPLLSSSYYENLTSENAGLLNMAIIKDPIRFNKDLHVFRVVCLEYGETVLNFYVGNYPSATNRNPAQMETSIKMVCCKPDSMHLSYKPKKEKKSSDKNIVKIPFYGDKKFEIDISLKDDIGRKLDNISSLDIIWMVSDNRVAKPMDYKDFITHVDASTGYQKVSRNFKEIEMTGKAGVLVVTAKLRGYRSDILTKEGIKNQIDLQHLSGSIELNLISLRDAYPETYEKYDEQENEEQCDKQGCKA